MTFKIPVFRMWGIWITPLSWVLCQKNKPKVPVIQVWLSVIRTTSCGTVIPGGLWLYTDFCNFNLVQGYGSIKFSKFLYESFISALGLHQILLYPFTLFNLPWEIKILVSLVLKKKKKKFSLKKNPVKWVIS